MKNNKLEAHVYNYTQGCALVYHDVKSLKDSLKYFANLEQEACIDFLYINNTEVPKEFFQDEDFWKDVDSENIEFNFKCYKYAYDFYTYSQLKEFVDECCSIVIASNFEQAYREHLEQTNQLDDLPEEWKYYIDYHKKYADDLSVTIEDLGSKYVNGVWSRQFLVIEE